MSLPGNSRARRLRLSPERTAGPAAAAASQQRAAQL